MSKFKLADFLASLRKDPELLERVNKQIDQMTEMIASGYGLNKIRKVMKSIYPLDFLYEVAHSRIKVRDKFTRSERLWLDDYSASFSTPEIIGKYRSSRIAGKKIIDIGSGAGLQALMFALNSDVVGVEISRERVEMARLNALEYGVKNVRFVHADYASVLENLEIDDETVIFSDPLRPKTEFERTLDSLVPSPKVITQLSQRFTSNFVFDLPPQMRWEEITIPGEKEYISLNGRLSRLTLYCGDVKRSESSAVILPEKIVLRGKPEDFQFKPAIEPQEYVYLIDPAVTHSKLLREVSLMGNFSKLSSDKRRATLCSDDGFIKNFPGEIFRTLKISDTEKLMDDLKSVDAARIFPRFTLEPEKYYTFKKEIEESLTGVKDVYIFESDRKYLLATKL